MDLGHLARLVGEPFNKGIGLARRVDWADLTTMLRKPTRAGTAERSGFSLLELIFVLAVTMIVLAIATPAVFRAIRTVRLQESAIDYASLLQRGRMRAVQDDRAYSVWIQPGTGGNAPIAYIDIKGHGDPASGGYYDPAPPNPDPLVLLSGDVQMQPAAAAPSTTALNSAFCSACTAPGSAAVILNTGPRWSPNGLPCRPTGSYTGVGTVCNAAGGPVAYVTYFQSNTTQAWEAVTVTPAGRVQVWRYAPNNSTWSTH